MVSNNHFAPLWSNIVFSQAVSIGTFCHSAQILKELGYRIFSGPFDWIFCNPAALSHILNDNFTTFLDRSYYCPVPESERTVAGANLCEHLYYKQNFGVHHLFNHHQPNEDPDYLHYVQAVNEFKSTLASPKTTLLYMVSYRAIPIEQYFELSRALDQYGGNYRFLATQFQVAKEGITPNIEDISTVHHDEKMLIINTPVRGASIGDRFAHPDDNQMLSDFLRTFRVGSLPIADFRV